MGRLAAIARSQAHAEYGPQISRVRRETGAQVHSLRSMQPALEAGLQLAEHQLRGAGLSARDLAIAESEMAHRSADVASSTALQIGQARSAGHKELVNLLENEGQKSASVLSTLQHEAMKHAQGVHDHQREEAERFRNDILRGFAEQHLGLKPSYSKNGLTPTQQRANNQSHHAAAFYAHEYVQAAKGGVTDKTGKVVIPAGPHNWTDEIWAHLTDKVAHTKGVSNLTDAQQAVQAIRDHFQPPQDSILHSLGKIVGAGAAIAPAVAPRGLAPIAQFGAMLLHHGG